MSKSSLIKFFPVGITNHHCYSVKCLNGTFYKVSIDGKYYDCNQILEVKTYGGSLTCPNPRDICSNEKILDWPEIDEVDKPVVNIDDVLTIKGRSLDIVTNVYIGNTPCKILSKSLNEIKIVVDYRDPYLNIFDFYPSLMIEVNETVNSCYDNKIFVIVIPIWITFIILLFSYYIMTQIISRQYGQVFEMKREIDTRLNKKQKYDDEEYKCCCCSC